MLKFNSYLTEAKATKCGRCGTTHVPPKFGGKCPAVKEGVNAAAKKPENYVDQDGKQRTRMVPVKKDIVKPDAKSVKESVKSAADEIHGDLLHKSVGAATDVKNYMDTVLKKHGLSSNHHAAVVKAVKAKGYAGKMFEGFNKGDSVTVKNAKKYDSLAKPEVSGTVIGKMGSKIMVKVGSGQMNVDPKDLIKEDVGQIDEISKKTLGSYIKKASKDAANSKANAQNSFKRGKDKEGFAQQDRGNKRLRGVEKAVDKLAKESAELEEAKMSPADMRKAKQIIQADDEMVSPAWAQTYRKASRELEKKYGKGWRKMVESVEIDEAAKFKHPAAQELWNYSQTSKAGIDKGYFQKAAGHIDQHHHTGNAGPLVRHIKGGDTDPRDHVMDVIAKHDKALAKSVAARAKLSEGLEEALTAKQRRDIEDHQARMRAKQDAKDAAANKHIKRVKGKYGNAKLDDVEEMTTGTAAAGVLSKILYKRNYDAALSHMKKSGKSAADVARMYKGVDARHLEKMKH